jgi:hypothetical protein
MADTAQHHFYIPVILGSTRRGRQSPKVALFIAERMRLCLSCGLTPSI